MSRLEEARFILEDAHAKKMGQINNRGQAFYWSVNLRYSARCKSAKDADALANDTNEVLDRIRYAASTPDAALTFRDGIAVLIATDDSGIDHEVMFKLGREARS